MSTYSNRLQPALQNLLQCVVRFFHLRSSCMMHILADVFGGRESLVKPVTAAENLQLYRVVRFFLRDRHARSISVDVPRITLNVSSCMTISGGRTEQLNIIAGFLQRHWHYECPFLSFIVVEHIRFFHGALQFFSPLPHCHSRNPCCHHTTVI